MLEIEKKKEGDEDMRNSILKEINKLQVSNFVKELLIIIISCLLGLVITLVLVGINKIFQIPYAGDNFSKFILEYCFVFCIIMYIGFKTAK